MRQNLPLYKAMCAKAAMSRRARRGEAACVSSFRHRSQSPVQMVIALIVSLPLTACIQGAAASGRAQISSIDSHVPPIYVAQTVVLLLNGQPLVEKQYRDALRTCQNAGAATTPLSNEDAGKVGRTYYQLWFDSKRSAHQVDEWNYDFVGNGVTLCRFVARHKSYKVVYTDSAIHEFDLIAHTATSKPHIGFLPGGRERVDDKQFNFATSSGGGLQRLGDAMDSGQRCVRWRQVINGTESCTWSEGRKWGFVARDGSNQLSSYDADLIVLWVHPGKGTGGELTTQKMTVGGKAFNNTLFEPPSGASIKRSEP